MSGKSSERSQQWEYRCLDCGNEVESDESPQIPLRKCEECGGRLQHVGPVLDECDRCHTDLLYYGNSGLGDDTLCDGCYEDMAVMM